MVPNQKYIDFTSCNKQIIKICVKYYHDCWKRRCVALHDPPVQRKVLQENVAEIKEETNKEKVEGLIGCLEMKGVNQNEVSENKFYRGQ